MFSMVSVPCQISAVVLAAVLASACGKAAPPAEPAEPAAAPAEPAAAPAEPAAAAPAEPAAAGADPHASRTAHAAAPGKSLPFTLVVALDPAAAAMMKAKAESIAVDFTVDDGVPGDDGGFRNLSFTLPGDGGILEVPGVDLSPAKESRAMTNFSITVHSARKSGPNNLLSCDASAGAVDTLLQRMVVNCKSL